MHGVCTEYCVSGRKSTIGIVSVCFVYLQWVNDDEVEISRNIRYSDVRNTCRLRYLTQGSCQTLSWRLPRPRVAPYFRLHYVMDVLVMEGTTAHIFPSRN